MFKRLAWVLYAAAVLLTGCATSPTYWAEPAGSAPAVDAYAPISCTFQEADRSIDGLGITAGYTCAPKTTAGGELHASDDLPDTLVLAGCRLVAEYRNASGALVPAHARCDTEETARLYVARNSSKWERPLGYTTSPTGSTSGTGSSASSSDSTRPSYHYTPCVYDGCGSVNVRGYYRKDGTYVRPHTRSAPGRGRR